jgi:hypothetical protein
MRVSKGQDVSFTAIPRVPHHHFGSFRLLSIDLPESAFRADSHTSCTAAGCTHEDRFDGETAARPGSE